MSINLCVCLTEVIVVSNLLCKYELFYNIILI